MDYRDFRQPEPSAPTDAYSDLWSFAQNRGTDRAHSPAMSEHETRVAFGMAGFWAGILLGFVLFGFPVHASHLSSPCCTERHSVEHVASWQQVDMPVYWD